MRDATVACDLKHVCEGRAGRPQGSALTCIALPILLDGILKETEQRSPGVETKAIQDDVGLYGDPAIILGEGGALNFILAEFQKVDLKPTSRSSRPTPPRPQSSRRPSRRSKRGGLSGHSSSRTRPSGPKSSTRMPWLAT